MDVDKYIEYELLLILMDVVLFRKFAFRHLLFNDLDVKAMVTGCTGCTGCSNYQEYDNATDGSNIAQKCSNVMMWMWRQLGYNYHVIVHFVMIASIRTILKLQGLDEPLLSQQQRNSELHRGLDNQNHTTFLQVFVLFNTITMMEYVVLYLGTLYSTKLIMACCCSKTSSSTAPKPSFTSTTTTWREVYLAIFLPPLFHLVALLVHIYENSSIVRLLSSTFIFGFTYVAVHCVVERIVVSSTTSLCVADTDVLRGKMKQFIITLSKIIPGWPFLFGLSLKFMLPQVLFLLVSLWDEKLCRGFNGNSSYENLYEGDGNWMWNSYCKYVLSNYASESIFGLLHQLLVVGMD